MGTRLAAFSCVLLLCGSLRAEPTLPLSLHYVPRYDQPLLGSVARLDVVLARYRLASELTLPPFNALRGGLRTNELEDQRRAQRVLASGGLRERSQGAEAGLLEGDLASVASLAASCVSFNLTLRPERRMPRFFLEPERSQQPWAVGLGLGRVGLGLRTEF